MTVTRDDVARRAGVSTAVVSYVLNDGPRRVSAERRARVLRAIEELGYRRDALAAALSSRRSGTLGLLLPDASNPFFAALAREIEDAAFARGFTVLIGNAAEDREREGRHLSAFQAHRVDGVIACLADVVAPLPDVLGAFGEHVVLVDRVPAGWSGRSVAVDNRHGGRIAAEHFLAAGRSRLAVLAGPSGFVHVEQRVAGFIDALPAGLHVQVAAAPTFDYAHGRATMATLHEVDGVFCCSDALAIGALGAIAATGKRVPDEVSVIGYDDIAQAAVSVPPLTTVAQPVAEMATRALAMLLDNAEITATLTPRLVVRESA